MSPAIVLWVSSLLMLLIMSASLIYIIPGALLGISFFLIERFWDYANPYLLPLFGSIAFSSVEEQEKAQKIYVALPNFKAKNRWVNDMNGVSKLARLNLKFIVEILIVLLIAALPIIAALIEWF